jgi:hypothetical protein
MFPYRIRQSYKVFLGHLLDYLPAVDEPPPKLSIERSTLPFAATPTARQATQTQTSHFATFACRASPY